MIINIDIKFLFNILLFVNAFINLRNVHAITTNQFACNCILAKDCEFYKQQLLRSSIEERKYISIRMRNAFCGYSFYYEVKVCCPGTSLPTIQMRYNGYSSPSESYAWYKYNEDYESRIWERRPAAKNKNLKQKYYREFHDMQQNALHRDGPNDLNGFNDYKDSKTLLNCPNMFYEADSNELVVSKSNTKYHHHNPGRLIYPDDERLHSRLRPMMKNTKIGKLGTLKPKKNGASSSTTQLTPVGINSERCGKMQIDEQFPWITRLAYRNLSNNRIGYRCSGSFISGLYIITAAHCVTNLVSDLQLSHVRLATASVTNGGGDLDLQIENVIVHPNYDKPKRANDIALIKIRRPLNTQNYGTICLPLNNITEEDLIRTTGVVAGWSNGEENADNSVKVQYLQLQIVNTTHCAGIYEKFSENSVEPIGIISTMLCAQGEPMKDVCQGDSGGPFMDVGSSGIFNKNGQYTLIGIVAFGPSCGRTQLLPGVYMRVNEFVNWIISNVR